MRFAKKLEFGDKTREVSDTAQRLVKRMKRDSLHTGRRPSGLCGAALLIAARLHEFSRSTSDIVKIVKVHESTLRKRLIEFGDTPTSALNLEEFYTVDLEQDIAPPSFKAARKRDRERLQKLMEEEADTITELQREIEMQLNKAANTKVRKKKDVEEDANKFIHESTMGTIQHFLQEEALDDPENSEEPVKGLGPDIASMGLARSLEEGSQSKQSTPALDVDLTFDDIDDAELDSYIMTEDESQNKSDIWMKRNASFLEEQRVKAEEKLRKEQEEGPYKKKRRTVRRKPMGPASSAGEAMEKIIQEKKISSKINYDVLKSLNACLKSEVKTEEDVVPVVPVVAPPPAKRPRLPSTEVSPAKVVRPNIGGSSRKVTIPSPKPAVQTVTKPDKSSQKAVKQEEQPPISEDETEDYYEEEEHTEDESANESSTFDVFRNRNEDVEDYEYDEEY